MGSRASSDPSLLEETGSSAGSSVSTAAAAPSGMSSPPCWQPRCYREKSPKVDASSLLRRPQCDRALSPTVVTKALSPKRQRPAKSSTTHNIKSCPIVASNPRATSPQVHRPGLQRTLSRHMASAPQLHTQRPARMNRSPAPVSRALVAPNAQWLQVPVPRGRKSLCTLEFQQTVTITNKVQVTIEV